MGNRLYLEGVNAWVAHTLEDGIEEKAEVDFLSPKLRRRLSPLGRAVMHSLKPLLIQAPDKNTAFVFASRLGDITLTEGLLNELRDPDGISPNRFSTSVHNAIGGQFCIFEHFTGFVTALGAGATSLSAALIEAQGLLTQFETVYLCFYESCLPVVFSGKEHHCQTFAITLKLRHANSDEPALLVNISEFEGTTMQTAETSQAVSQVMDFFEGRTESWSERESGLQYLWYRQ